MPTQQPSPDAPITPDSEAIRVRELIRANALKLGFSDCRFCTSEPPRPEIAAAFNDWLNQGMNGSMGFLVRARKGRDDLSARFPWAKSVVVLRRDYPNGRAGEEEMVAHSDAAHRDRRTAAGGGSILPRVARYAAQLDYHDQLKESLEQFQDYLSRHAPGGHALWYQDTGPILEHVYAERAGIGWTGKHTLTLNRASGSYFLLAEVITSIDIPPDPPATNHCGACTACIDACPTDAIFEPYKLDARRCISYLTIEHKGSVPEEFRDKLDGYLFGCDVCQEVCPYVRKEVEQSGVRVAEPDWAKPELATLTLLDVLMLRDPKLEAAVVGTPLHRTGAARLKRSAALLAGTERIEACIKGINHCLTHPEPMVREACVWALGRFAGTEHAAKVRQFLVTHQKRETDEAMREQVIQTLRALREDAEPDRSALSQAAIWALEKIKAEGIEDAKDGDERDDDPEVVEP